MPVQVMNARLHASPFNAWLGLGAVAASHGYVRIELPWRRELSGRPDRDDAHGGALASLLDVAGSYAIASLRGLPVATVDLRSDYHRPFTQGTAIADAEVVHAAAPVSTVHIRVTASDGRLLASGIGSYLTPVLEST